jgi:hypothetical protein
MNLQQFGALLGGVAVIVALIFLANSVSTEYESGVFGRVTTDCGTVFSPDDTKSGPPAEACDDAIGARKAWTLPVGIGGLVVLAAALLIRTPTRPTQPTE